MTTALTRLLLRDEASREDVERVLLEDGWQLVNVFLRGRDWPLQVVFGSSAQDVWVHFVDDDRYGARYVCIVGGETGAIERTLRERVAVCDHADMTAALHAARDPSSLMTALRRAALAVAPRPRDADEQAEVLGWLMLGVDHADVSVAEAAVRAFAIVRWPVIFERMRQLASEHPDGAVRDAARMAVAMQEGPET